MSGRTSAPGRITPHDGRAGREADFAYETLCRTERGHRCPRISPSAHWAEI